MMMTWFMTCSPLEQLVIVGTVIFLTILFVEALDCIKIFSGIESNQLNYGYEHYNGPIVWKCHFPASRGKCQSPINISTQNVVCVPAETFKSIKFSSEYYDVPVSLIAMNDGHTLVLYGCWDAKSGPQVSGGALKETYKFDSIRFRWGPSDDEGSEHTIDAMRYPMEIQAIHVKENKSFNYLHEAVDDKAIMIISYLFEITPMDNPYLEPLFSCVKDLQVPYSKCRIQPFPLSWLVLPFTSKYYFYTGSLTFPPCTEGVEWMIQSETMSISSRQVRKLRSLCSLNGPIETNTRPVQELNGRCLYFYD